MDKRIVAILLSLCMLLSIMPVMAQTEDADAVLDAINSAHWAEYINIITDHKDILFDTESEYIKFSSLSAGMKNTVVKQAYAKAPFSSIDKFASVISVAIAGLDSSSGGSGGGIGGGIARKSVVTLSKAGGYIGDTVDITLDISGNNGFSNLGLEINYDDSVLTLLAVSENPEVGAIFTAAEHISTNPYNMTWDSESDVGFNGTLATLTFKITDNAPVGDYPVILSCYKGRNGDYTDGIDVNYDENDNPLNLNYESGYINISYAPIKCPEASDDNTFNGNVYMVFDRQVSWAEASKQCEEAGGHLATITSAKENNFIQTLCSKGNSNQYYLGASNSLNNGIWSWIGSESFVYTNWSDNEPNVMNSQESYLAIQCANGKWNTIEKNSAPQIGFVCEWEGNNTGSDSSYWVEFISKKDSYAIGEAFEVDVWLYTDDSVMKIYDNDYTVSGFDSSKPGIYNVTVSYEEYSRTFEVEVVDGKEAEAVITHVIQAHAKEGVTISPSGYCEVKDGTIMKFVVGIEEGYTIDSVSVNGELVKLTDSNLTVTVDQNTVIEVLGKKKTYSVKSTAYGNGYIELSSDTVSHGSNCSARIVSNEGYIVSDVKIDGVSVGACKLYTFTNVTENHTVEAVFEKIVQTLTVKASASEGGRVSPSRSIINSGGTATISAIPDNGYHIGYAVVNGEILNIKSNGMTFDNITENTDILIVFEKNVYTVSVAKTEGAQMSVECNGQSAPQFDVPYMTDVTVVLDIEEGYKLNTLYVNGISVKAQKSGGKLTYRTNVSENTVISARCGLTLVSEFNQDVARAGLAADINVSNAYSKKEEFAYLANKYANLSKEEKSVCTSAYATVLSALDRANAYIALIESEISDRILQMPSPDELTSENYRSWKEKIDNAYADYENMTYLAKSLIDLELVAKLSGLKTKSEELDKESKGAILYLYELIDSVPDTEASIADNLTIAYSKLLLAENTYHNMSEESKKEVSEEKYSELIAKHGKISTQIQKLYAAPFTSKVLRCSGVSSTDNVADAEAKRAVIYELMNEYHSFPTFVQEQISSSTVQKLNSLYESASIKVSTTLNNQPVDINGDFNEDVELIITEPELDNNAVADSTGKSVYLAIDVKMYSEAQEVQPTSKIRMKMEISKELFDADVSVVYINDAGEMYDVQGEMIEENGKYYIVFFIDHFSNFAVLYNETVAPDTVMTFDVEYAEVGDYITATVTGLLNSSGCTLYVAGYSATGALTFAKTGSTDVSVTIAENTVTVKAMLWDKNMLPVINPTILSVSGVDNENESQDVAISFDKQYAKEGDYITATVTGADASDFNLFIAGYSKTGVVTFVEFANKNSVSAIIAKNTVTIKAMLWDENMLPLVEPTILSVSGDGNENESHDISISFDKQYAKEGDYITATATDTDTSDCNLFIAGYSKTGTVTFVEFANKNSVSAIIAKNTVTVKALLWDKNMAPLINPATLSVSDVDNES